MPLTVSHEDDDPVVASYDVYLTNPLPTESESSTASRLFVLQYPSHRPSSKPYNAARSQKPTRLRLKPHTGMIEVDVPILTNEHFNVHAGEKYGQALTESRISQMGGSHGLAGGFTSGPLSAQNIRLNDIPEHEDTGEKILNTQTLGGKIMPLCERDPVYMLGTFRDNQLYLTHLDAVVQMRPQLHHIDAEEENNQKRFQAQAGSGKIKEGLETGPVKRETKAIELKMKEIKEEFKDQTAKSNAHLLRDIQADQWTTHEWIDEDERDSWQKAQEVTTLKSDLGGLFENKQLKSMLSNDDWLEKMSVPREDGKKGLRAKLKGRDRERARRKKVEHQRQQTNAGSTNTVSRTEISSDSDLSSIDEHFDADVPGQDAPTQEVNIKEESSNQPAAAAPSASGAAPTETTPKKRGRPKKIA